VLFDDRMPKAPSRNPPYPTPPPPHPTFSPSIRSVAVRFFVGSGLCRRPTQMVLCVDGFVVASFLDHAGAPVFILMGEAPVSIRIAASLMDVLDALFGRIPGKIEP